MNRELLLFDNDPVRFISLLESEQGNNQAIWNIFCVVLSLLQTVTTQYISNEMNIMNTLGSVRGGIIQFFEHFDTFFKTKEIGGKSGKFKITLNME